MSGPVIAFYGNCVANALVDVLSAMPTLTRHFEIDGTTFARDRMTAEKMARTVLFITQDRLFGIPLPLPEDRDRMPPDCAVIRIPNVMFSSVWPLSCRDPRDRPDLEHPFGRHSRTQTDRLALEIMRTVADPASRRDAYLAVDVKKRIDLGRYHEIHAEQMVEMERGCDVQVAAHVLTTFRKRRLFYAAHHPTPALMLYLVAQIIGHPRFAPFRRASVAALLSEAARFLDAHAPFQGEEVPIHPQVARFFGLEWWTPTMTYQIDRLEVTFEEWLDHYMADPLPEPARGITG